MSDGKFSVFTSSYVNTALNQSAFRICKCYIIIKLNELCAFSHANFSIGVISAAVKFVIPIDSRSQNCFTRVLNFSSFCLAHTTDDGLIQPALGMFVNTLSRMVDIAPLCPQFFLWLSNQVGTNKHWVHFLYLGPLSLGTLNGSSSNQEVYLWCDSEQVWEMGFLASESIDLLSSASS